jgi:hypothetical protein
MTEETSGDVPEVEEAQRVIQTGNLRSLILAAVDVPEEVLDVPEWGTSITVRGLTGKQRDAFEAEVFVIRGSGKQVKSEYHRINIRARLVSLSIVDPVTKERVFTDADIETLGDKSAVVLDRIFEVAQRLAGMRDEDIEELEKN